MSATIINMTYNKCNKVAIFGGFRLESEYYIETTQNGIKNDYTVTAEIRGLSTGDIFLQPTHIERHHNNAETLIDEAVRDLFEEHIN